MKRTLLLNIIIALLGALIFIPGLGCVRLFDWDEINFAESAREMLLTGNWLDVQINFQPFWEKPPLFIWMQALSMKVFGVNEFAARFPNAVMGIVTLLLLFNIGRRTEGERFGLLWAMMYGISFLPFLYFKSGIIDPWFNVFIFLGIYYFARYSAEEARRMRLAALSALFLGLATMTKGPVGFLIFCLTAGVWLIVRRFRFSFRWKDVGVFFAVLALVGGSWFLVLALSGHSDVIRDFIQYQIRLFQTKDAGHGGFFLYHFVILLLGVVPASIFALSCFERNSNTVGPLLRETAPSRQKNWVNDVWTQSPSDGSNLASGRKEPVGPSGGRVASDGISPMSLSSEGTLPAVNGANLKSWMIVSFWVVLILFTIVKTKIVHYSSFCFFPISFMAAWAAERMMEGRLKFRRYQRILLIVIASAYGFLLAGLAQFDSLKEIIIPYVQDPFAVSCMAAESNWTSWVLLVGPALIAATAWFCTSFRRHYSGRSFVILAAGHILFSLTAILCAVPEIEKYSQASAVDFYIGLQGEDCYVKPAYFKSYAHYFYTQRQPGNALDDFGTLCRGDIDKDCYFVLKDEPGAEERLRNDAPEAQLLYRKPGFLFFVRQHKVEGDELENQQGEQNQIE